MDWKELRGAVWERDDKKCVVCGQSTGSGQIHHLVHRKHGGSNDLSNLVTLCGRCHMLESNTPDFAVHKAFKIPLNKLKQERQKVINKLKEKFKI